MRLLRWMPAALLLLTFAHVAFAQDDQADETRPAGPVAAVTHVTTANCDAKDQSFLAARRKLKAPAPSVFDAGNGYKVTRWAAPADAGNQPDVPVEFVLVEKSGTCQLLAAAQSVTLTALHLPLTDAPAPQLIITRYSGGAHCCFAYDILSFGKHYADDVIDSADSSIDINGLGDGDAPDISYSDMAFAYWNADFASSPAGTVRLTWDQDRYRLSDPKDQPAPGEAVLAAWQSEMTAAIKALPVGYVSIADQNKGTQGPQLDPVIWSHLLDLIYDGYPDLAVKLYAKAWPDEVKGKDIFWKDFVAQLQQQSVLWKPWHLDAVLTPDLPKVP